MVDTVHGRTNSVAAANAEDIPATHLFATFISSATTDQLSAGIKAKVQEVLLDYIGVTLGAVHHADSTKPVYKAIKALQSPVMRVPTINGNVNGNLESSNSQYCSVLGHGPPHFLPRYAALLNAAFAHSLDFDDTYAPGTLQRYTRQ